MMMQEALIDKSRWSSRYYRTDCDRMRFLMRTDGPDDRPDPPAGTRLPCLVEDHDEHLILRVSPDDWQRLNEDLDDEPDSETPWDPGYPAHPMPPVRPF